MHRELKLLLATVLVLAVGAVATAALLWRASQALSEGHDDIVDSAMPSVVALDDAQVRLRQLHLLALAKRPELPIDPVRRAEIADARAELSRDIDGYLTLPVEPGEALLHDAVHESLARLDATLERALDLDGAVDDNPAFRGDLDAAVTRLSADLARASEFNAHVASSYAEQVDRVSRSALPAAAVVGALTFLAATVVLALTFRAVRRAEALAARSLASLARRADELELFAGRVAHDLLSPLMTVGLALDLAAPRLTDPKDAGARHAVARATGTLRRVRRFVSDLLEFARSGAEPAAGARTDVDAVVHEVVDELVPLARDASVDLHVEPEHTTRSVACSPGVLTSVLSNLVQHAIKYTGEGATRQVCIRIVEQPADVRVEVEDTGAGIAPEERERAFEPYARGRDVAAPGFGLGLATVKRLVEAHGGHVGVQTTPGHGSLFWFSLPSPA